MALTELQKLEERGDQPSGLEEGLSVVGVFDSYQLGFRQLMGKALHLRQEWVVGTREEQARAA